MGGPKSASARCAEAFHLYLVGCSFDPNIVIFGATANLKQRLSSGAGYGELIWSFKAEHGAQAAAWEKEFARRTERYCVEPLYAGLTTWTEARFMTEDAALRTMLDVTKPV